MKWEIKDEWIYREYPEHHRFPELESSLHFFREWGGHYWYRNIFIRTTSECMSRNLRPMIRAAFNQANDNKIFRNCKLYHGRLLKIRKIYNQFLILARDELVCNGCKKVVDPNKTIYFEAFRGNQSFIVSPSPWEYYTLDVYCPTCRKIEKLIE